MPFLQLLQLLLPFVVFLLSVTCIVYSNLMLVRYIGLVHVHTHDKRTFDVSYVLYLSLLVYKCGPVICRLLIV